MEGYHVKPWETPESVMVFTKYAGWVYLKNDGAYNHITKPEEECT